MARFCPEAKRRPVEREKPLEEGSSYKPLEEDDLDEATEPVQFLLHSREQSLDDTQGKERMLRKWLHNSSSTPDSLNNEEEEEEEDYTKEGVSRGGEVCCLGSIKVTGSCFCKLFVVLYLLTCLLVSALYIAIYGPNELYLMPETSPTYKPSKPVQNIPPFYFYDNPYIEWITQKWTYSNEEFADWAQLPEGMDSIKQTIAGSVDGQEGVWLLDTNNLYFVLGFGRVARESIHFLNMSLNLDLNLTNDSYLALLDRENLLIVSTDDIVLLNCSQSSIEYCDVSLSWPAPDYGFVQAASVSFSDYKSLWIGTSEGLYHLNISSTHPDENITLVSEIDGSVLSLAWRAGLVDHKGLNTHSFLLTNSSNLVPQDVSYNNGHSVYLGANGSGFGLLVIGTENKLYFYDGNQFWSEWVSSCGRGIRGVIDGSPIALTFLPSGDLFIANNISVSRLHINYTFERIGPEQGLPYNQILSLHHTRFSISSPPLLRPLFFGESPLSCGLLLIGTRKGYSLFDVSRSLFVGYRYGPRWLPSNSVSSITSLASGVFVMVTERGLAVINAEEWTLERKATHYQQMLAKHTREPGLVSDCLLTNFASSSSCDPSSTDNDGLRTAWSIAAEAFRYQATRCEEARTNAWYLYKGLKFLVDVTGIPGLPARSVLKESNFTNNLSNDWHMSVTNPGWFWKGDTSSDEIVGHIFAYSVVYDLVADTLKEKMDVASTLDSIISYIISNDFTLVDVTNRTTRWGVWSPNQINFNESWADKRGLNSLEILTGLLSAYRMTVKEEYITSWKELVNEYHYGLNIINQKVNSPHDTSNNELAFLQYFVYIFTLRYLGQHESLFSHHEAMTLGQLSLRQTWTRVRKEKSSAWTSIYSFATGENDTDLLEDLVWSLRLWPLDLIQWPSINSHRLDIHFNSEQDRHSQSHSQSIRVLPPNERTQLRWSTNPYQLDSEGSSSEMDPCPWLMPYWLARWIKLL